MKTASSLHGNGAAAELVFSVVVPTYRRPEQVSRLLASLCELDYPRERFEVILVDDGGGDVEAVAGLYRSRLNLTLLTAGHKGCAHARQHGVDHARGRFLAFTDDDCRPGRDWLKELESVCVQNHGVGFGSPITNVLESDWCAEASQLVVNALTESANREAGSPVYFPTSNLVLPVEGFRAIGGLDRSWRPAGGEDRDLCSRWIHSGRQLREVPEALVYHHHGLSIGGFLRQHFEYGRGAYFFRAKRRVLTGCRLSFENWRFYAFLPFRPWRRMRGAKAFAVALLIVLSQAATALGFGRELLRPTGSRNATSSVSEAAKCPAQEP